MDFNALVSSIQLASEQFKNSVSKAINIHLTLRNWVVGFYIVEFEQMGEDRAAYGDKLMVNIAKKMTDKGLSETNLKLCRQLYNMYPQLLGNQTLELSKFIPPSVATTLPQIRQTLSDKLQVVECVQNRISQTPSDPFQNNENYHYLATLVKSASFSHFVELIKIDEPVKRKFYELLILKTTPSVREFQRQINSLSYERLGISANTEHAFATLQQKITPVQNADIIKSHYVFEFLNLNQSHLIEESELEQALIQHLQKFILELGDGFCFEARQKRILIGDEYYFIDLVFYHRILKCHVLVELKTEKANHEHIGQLKTYLNYYKKNMMLATDNPPVGILLVTHQNKTLVEYAIADSDIDIFVSQYLLQLPKKEELELFINNELINL